MHELSIAEALVKQINEIAAKERAKKIEKVYLEIGTLSGVDCYALEAALPFASEGTSAEGAAFVIKSISAKVRCKDCSHEWDTAEIIGLCPVCEKVNIEVVQGRELILKSLDIKTNDA